MEEIDKKAGNDKTKKTDLIKAMHRAEQNEFVYLYKNFDNVINLLSDVVFEKMMKFKKEIDD
jgi:phage host-nuclease inhibitor protein Gam